MITEKQCTKCNRILPLTHFHPDNRKKDGKQARCKDCANILRKQVYRKPSIDGDAKGAWLRRQERKQKKNDVDYIIQQKLYKTKDRAAEKGWEFNLTQEYLKELLIKQNFKCYYSDELLIFGQDIRKEIPSIDRVNPDKGYTIGNIVWCKYGINALKRLYSIDEFYQFCLKIKQLRNKLKKSSGGYIEVFPII